jgi:hypothetical protein
MKKKVLTPLKAIRKYCLCCGGDQAEEVRFCPVEDCPIYPLRFGKKPGDFKKSVLKAIKERCFDCSAFEWKEVRECSFDDCALFEYRKGKNPRRKGIGNMNLRVTHTLKEMAGNTVLS